MISIGRFDQKQSEFKDDDLVCYCFEFKKKDIEKDFLENGYSAILDKISNEKKINGCDCVNKNPKKR